MPKHTGKKKMKKKNGKGMLTAAQKTLPKFLQKKQRSVSRVWW